MSDDPKRFLDLIEQTEYEADIAAAEQAGFERGVAWAASQNADPSGPCLDLIEAAVQAERERIISLIDGMMGPQEDEFGMDLLRRLETSGS